MLLSLLKSMRSAAPVPTAPDAPQSKDAFAAALSGLVAQQMHAVEQDNVDRERFPHGDEQLRAHERALCEEMLAELLAHPDEFERTYELFDDEASRALYVQLVAYRLLGHARLRLPTNNTEHWAAREAVGALPAQQTSNTGPMGPVLAYDLDFDGERIALEAWAWSVTWTFFLRQYYFDRDGIRIAPRRGDRVIDAGAFFAETALVFAASVGPEGRVASFEIDPANLKMARHNLGLNPALAQRIDLRECALADSTAPLYLMTCGPASVVTDQPTEHRVEVQTIDGFVQSGALDRVDFIKMDIEGAERLALWGATETLRRYRPALAISIYHRPDDLWKIALFLADLKLGYRFHLDHYTIYNAETVLYASAA